MADELDKFVLRYEVQLGDTTARLESLEARLAKVNEAGAKAGTTMMGSQRLMARFAAVSMALSHQLHGAGGMTSSVHGAAGAFHALGMGTAGATRQLSHILSSFARFGAATGGIVGAATSIGIAIKIAADQAAELNRQADRAVSLGTTPLRMEQFSRTMVQTSGGLAGYKDANTVYDKMGDMLQSAYTNPYQNNREAWLLRMAGVDINGNGGIADTDVATRQLAHSFSGMDEGRAQGIGHEMGLTKFQVEALIAMGKAAGDSAKMTDEQTQAYLRAQAASRELAQAQGRMSEKWRELKLAIAEDTLPILVELINGISRFSHAIGDELGPILHEAGQDIGSVIHAISGANDIHDVPAVLHGTFAVLAQGSKMMAEILNAGASGDMDQVQAVLKEFQDFSTTDIYTKAYQAEETRQKSIIKSEELQKMQNTQSRQTMTDFERMMNLFGMSVNKFADSIDERQAWADWAGAAGAAGGLTRGPVDQAERTNQFAVGGPVNEDYAAAPWANLMAGNQMGGPGGYGYHAAPDAHDFDSLFRQAGDQYGIDPLMLKKVSMQESSLNPANVSPKGARGLMQIMPQNDASLGITDWRDPYQNVFGGARLLRQLLNQAQAKGLTGTDAENWALRAYNGGTGGPGSRAWSSSENLSYVGDVRSQAATLLGPTDAAAHAALTPAVATPPALPAPDAPAPARAAPSKAPAKGKLSMGDAWDTLMRWGPLGVAAQAWSRGGIDTEPVKEWWDEQEGRKPKKQAAPTVIDAGIDLSKQDPDAKAPTMIDAGIDLSKSNPDSPTVIDSGLDLSRVDPDTGAPTKPAFGNPLWDAYNPQAKPTTTFGPGMHQVRMDRPDGSVRGRSYDSQQYLWMEQQVAGNIGQGVTPGMLANHQISKGDIRWAESNLYNQWKTQEMSLAQQFAALKQVGGRPEQLRDVQSQLADTGAHIKMMQAYGGQIAARGVEGDRSLTIGQQRTPAMGISDAQVQALVNINVYGAQNDKKLVDEIHSILRNEFNDLAHANSSMAAR